MTAHRAESGTAVEAAEHTREKPAHASRATYWIVALILGIVTLLEVAVFYVPVLRAIIVPTLLVLSSIKFTLVAGFFMHLKYDRPVLIAVFAGGLAVALFIVLALYFLFHVFGRAPTAG